VGSWSSGRTATWDPAAIASQQATSQHFNEGKVFCIDAAARSTRLSIGSDVRFVLGEVEVVPFLLLLELWRPQMRLDCIWTSKYIQPCQAAVHFAMLVQAEEVISSE
jgi:hypothetical protein